MIQPYLSTLNRLFLLSLYDVCIEYGVLVMRVLKALLMEFTSLIVVSA